MMFNVAEMNLMCIFDHSSKEALLADMAEALPEIDDPEMAELMCETMKHIEAVSIEKFAELAFIPAKDDDGEWGDDDETD